MARKTQQEVNFWFQDNTVKSALDLSLIEKVLHNNNLDIPNNIIINKNGNTYDDFARWYCDETKISKYPTSYKECCEVLGCKANHFFTDFSYNGLNIEISNYEDKIDDLLQNFRKLRYCRDAYWKIAGEELGLDKPWEPDWTDGKIKYGITYYRDFLTFYNCTNSNKILVFPTEEMRKAFFENFNYLIVACKTLL